ncbi:hypothetical protein AVEN_245180-1 [Araneus ventricosus]|uniref:Uncharacterized protein n=1 Tax=Araneus ventricosus TaxID=182803 RepID=A0A4Y2QG71_ARAVE|nr:hypothetical protein AVEN_245180-1 [Araneus ventricosus]
MIDVEDASADEEENDTVPPLQAKAPSIEVDSTAEKKLPDTPPASEEDVSVTTPEPIVPEPTAPTETVPLQKDATPPESQSLAKVYLKVSFSTKVEYFLRTASSRRRYISSSVRGNSTHTITMPSEKQETSIGDFSLTYS